MNSEMRANTVAFEQTVRSTIALAGTFTPEGWKLPTDLPGWSVQDIVSHLAGIELLLLGEDPAEGHVLAEDPPHVRNDLARLIEPGVDVRRGRPGTEIVAELADVLERRLVAIPEIDPSLPTPAPGSGRLIPYAEFMGTRAFDCWAHEQDIRRAVGRPGNLDAPAAACARRILEPGLPMIVAKRAGAGKGTTVVFEVSEPLSFTSRIVVGDDGRGRLADASGPEGGAPDLTLRMDWETFFRLGAGRCGPSDVTVAVDGDIALASRVLSGMALTP